MPSETLISHFNPSSSPLTSSKPPYLPPPPPPPHPTTVPPMSPSIPTTAKSSNWLHRLRSSRGFPDSDHIDLEHFLSTSRHQIDPPDSTLLRKKPPPEDHSLADDHNGASQGRDLINNVLSDLFFMRECDDQSKIKKKKSSRKQPCPRIHVVSPNSDVRNVTSRKDRLVSRSSRSTVPLTLSSGHRVVKEVSQVRECVEKEKEEEEEKEKARWDMSGYSQTEVTVIDTSVPCWKFEKVLYRRKNVWKVGDKKGKGLVSGDRKKRKDRLDESGGDAPKKKLKKKLKLLKYADKEGSMGFSKSDQGHDQGKMVAGNEKKRDKCSQVQEKSFCKKQTEGGSSVILIKSIPTTNKRNVPGISNGCVKTMQR